MADTNTTHVNGTGSLLRVPDVPPGKAGEPYVISTQDGEIIYIPLSRSATRLLVTGKESENAFAVVGSSGSQSDPIGFHYHREAHDVFLCLKGEVNVWAGEKCRTLGAGDFASASPGTVHQYQILGHHSEMVGLIVPGGWEEFFRFIGEPYAGPLWPLNDNRNFFEVMLPKLKAAAEQFDMVPCPQHQHSEPDPRPWVGDENKLPGKAEPYFLKSGTGPAWLSGGTVVRPLITTAESNGRFVIGSIEGSSHHHEKDLFSGGRKLKFEKTHHAFQVVEGVVEFTLGSSSPAFLHAGELVYVPAGTELSIRFRSRFAKLYAFASGKGVVELLTHVGKPYDAPIPPETADNADHSLLDGLKVEHGFSVHQEVANGEAA